MKIIFYPILALFFLGLTACSQSPTKVDAPKGAPAWTTTTPEHADYFYAVESMPATDITVEEAKAALLPAAQKTISAKFKDFIGNATIELKGSEDYSAIENRVRIAVRKPMRNRFKPTVYDVFTYTDTTENKIYVLYAADKVENKVMLKDYLTQLDTQLLDYIHSSPKGGNLYRLMSLLPSLPTLEERAMVKATYQALNNETINMPNERLAKNMNAQITQLFGNVVVGVSALTAETEKLEKPFIQALNHTGLNISVRYPDLTLKYYIESDITNDDDMVNLEMISDIELLKRDTSVYSTINIEQQALGITTEKAQEFALKELSEKITDTIIEKMTDYISDVNRLNYDR